MKKLGLFLVVLTLLGGYACKKNSSSTKTIYSIDFTADGSQHSLKFTTGAHLSTIAPGETLTIVATGGQAPTDDVFYILLSSIDGKIKAGDTFNGSDSKSASIGYGTNGEGAVYANSSLNNTKANVTITSINATSIKGTFSASLSHIHNGTKKEITNGSFELNIQ